MIKTDFSGQYQAEIMLNLNIMLRNFTAEIIILPYTTEAEMKNGVTYKNRNVYLKINICLKQSIHFAIQARVAII